MVRVMPRITLRLSSDVLDRLHDEARTLDLAHERATGAPPVRRTSAAAAATALLMREFERRDAKAARARAGRRAG
jgi:hypothetical protein